MPTLITEYKRNPEIDFEAAACDLLILSDTKYFIYMVISQRNTFELLREYKQEDGESFSNFHAIVLKNDDMLSLSYRNVHIGLTNKRLVLVPESVFDEVQVRQYLENSTPIWNSDQILVDKLNKLHIRLVYAFRKSILHLYQQHFPNALIVNTLTQYIKATFELLTPENEGYRLFVNVSYDSMFIVLYRNRELTFANVYEFATKEDFLYYIMLIFKEFQLDHNNTPTYISGKLDSDSIIHDLVFQYIRQLMFIEVHNTEAIVIPDIPAHLYFDLIATQL